MLTISPQNDPYEETFRQMIFDYWQELMPKSTVLETDEKREAYFESEFASGDVYGVWNQETLVGYIHLKIRGNVGGLAGIYIVPSARRQGYGKQLMQWMFEQYDQRGIEQIDLYVRRDNPTAKVFYEALGFGVAGYRMRMYRENGEVLPIILSSDS